MKPKRNIDTDLEIDLYRENNERIRFLKQFEEYDDYDLKKDNGDGNGWNI